ncbi:MAG: phytanoyl-CoA dioxygenase family protein [Woeseiaceae bacterium]
MTDFDFAALKRDYDRDGFVVLPGYLSSGEVEALRDRAVPLAKKLLEEVGDSERYRNVLKSLNQYDDWFDEQLSDGRHVPLMHYLMGGDVRGVSAAWFDRPEGESLGIDPHVDAIGRNKRVDAGATIWIALDPVDAGNGCLHYLRRSHFNEYPDAIPIPGIDTESEDAIAVELSPGDAVIHNALTVHWSGGNETGQPRRAVSFFYFGAKAHAALHQQKEA